jgi:hypothetical protein
VGLASEFRKALFQFLVFRSELLKLVVSLEKHGTLILHVYCHAFRLLVSGLSRRA